MFSLKFKYHLKITLSSLAFFIAIFYIVLKDSNVLSIIFKILIGDNLIW